MSDVGRWSPIQGSHAIQMAAVGVSFSEALPEPLWNQARGKAAARATELGLTTEIPQTMLQFIIGPGSVPTPQVAGAPVGIDFTKMERPDFYSDKFSINKQSLRIEEWSYTRWATMRAKAETLMADAFEVYGQSTTISSVFVDYIDVFRALAGDIRANCEDVISRDSKYVAPAAFDRINPWHTHTAHYESIDTQVRRLVQVNVDVGDLDTREGPAQAIQIRTLVTDQMNLPGRQPIGAEHQTWPALIERMQALHDSSKSRFRSMLTSQAAAAISMI